VAANKPNRSRVREAVPSKKRRDWVPTWLRAYGEYGTVTAASKAARISRVTAYQRRKRDEAFADAWDDLEQEVTDNLERSGIQRAMDGSDRLVEFFLRARRPNIYRDRVDHSHSGSAEAPAARLDVSKLDLEEARQLRRLLGKAATKQR
jgi:hypothetical protein